MKDFITIFLFSILVLYQTIGVTIHDQYGFGFFYWPIQEGLLVVASLYYILININRVKILFDPKFFLYHLYILIIILYLSTYYLFYKVDAVDNNDIGISILHTFDFYLISLALVLNFKNLILLSKLKKILLVYALVVASFFIFTIHIQENIFLALTMGPNFPPQMMDTLPGYTWGFHLFFSTFFIALTFYLIFMLKKENKQLLLYMISFMSLYVLLLAGGRGSLLTFSIVLFLFTLPKKASMLFLSFFILISFSTNFLVDTFSGNERMYKLLIFDLGDDGSANGRSMVFHMNLKIIEQNLLVGSYHQYAGGWYIHNILSILQDYGILAFATILIIILHAIYLSLFKTRGMNNEISVLIARNIFLFETLDHLFFKYSTDMSSLLLFFTSYLYLILALQTRYFEKFDIQKNHPIKNNLNK